MKLAILVNSAAHLQHVVGLTRAAASKGHAVSLFTMDEGVGLLEDPAYAGLCRLDGVTLGLCEHSAKGYGLPIEGLPREIVRGSQYQNAVMTHHADRVIVL